MSRTDEVPTPVGRQPASAPTGSPERATPYDKHFTYRRDFMDIAPRFFLRTNLMLSMIKDRRGRVLDIGCGDGFFLRRLARRGYSGIGIDVSEIAIERARQVLASYPECEVHRTSIESFGPSGSYDLVTCGETLEHIEHDADFLRQIHRLMATAGTLVLTVPIDMSLWTEQDARAGHFRRYDKAELFAKLRQTGFEVQRYEIWGFPLVRLLQSRIREAQDSRMSTNGGQRPRPRDLLLQLKPLLRAAKYAILVDNLFNFTELGVGIVVKATKLP